MGGCWRTEQYCLHNGRRRIETFDYPTSRKRMAAARFHLFPVKDGGTYALTLN